MRLSQFPAHVGRFYLIGGTYFEVQKPYQKNSLIFTAIKTKSCSRLGVSTVIDKPKCLSGTIVYLTKEKPEMKGILPCYPQTLKMGDLVSMGAAEPTEFEESSFETLIFIQFS